MADVVVAKDEVRAKLFANGRSQAVRLPKEFRFDGKEVKIRRALGGVLLEPLEDEQQKPWKTLDELYARFTREETEPILSAGREQPQTQERDWNSFE